MSLYGTESNYTCHGEYFTMCMIVESLYYTTDTNIMLYINHTSI